MRGCLLPDESSYGAALKRTPPAQATVEGFFDVSIHARLVRGARRLDGTDMVVTGWFQSTRAS